jgi:hypothetical protein
MLTVFFFVCHVYNNRGLDEADFEKVADFFDRAVDLTVELKVRSLHCLLHCLQLTNFTALAAHCTVYLLNCLLAAYTYILWTAAATAIYICT